MLPHSILRRFDGVFIFLLRSSQANVRPNSFRRVLRRHFSTIRLLFKRIYGLFSLQQQGDFILGRAIMSVRHHRQYFRLIQGVYGNVFRGALLPLLIIYIYTRGYRRYVGKIGRAMGFSLPITTRSYVQITVRATLSLLSYLFRGHTLPLRVTGGRTPRATTRRRGGR